MRPPRDFNPPTIARGLETVTERSHIGTRIVRELTVALQLGEIVPPGGVAGLPELASRMTEAVGLRGLVEAN